MKLNKIFILLLAAGLLFGIAFWWWKSPASDRTKQKAADKVMPTIGTAAQITDIDAERIKLVSKVTLYTRCLLISTPKNSTM